MPNCPRCSIAMTAAQVISLAGIHNKVVSWRCQRDGIEAAAVHPVQIAHMHVGQEEEKPAGRRTRLIHMEMTGAELILFREILSRDAEQSHA